MRSVIFLGASHHAGVFSHFWTFVNEVKCFCNNNHVIHDSLVEIFIKNICSAVLLIYFWKQCFGTKFFGSIKLGVSY